MNARDPIIEKLFNIVSSKNPILAEQLPVVKNIIKSVPKLKKLRQKEIAIYDEIAAKTQKMFDAGEFKAAEIKLSPPPEISLNFQEKWIEHGAEKAGDTLLILAVVNKHHKIIEDLIDGGADPNLQNVHGETPLTLAASCGFEDVVELLLKKKADPDIQNNGWHTALMLAIQHDHREITQKLIQKSNVDLKSNHDCKTALMVACEFGRVDRLRDLKRKRANPNSIQEYYSKKNALMWAIENGTPALIDEMLSYPKINLTLRDKDGKTALIYAAEKGNVYALTALLQQPAVDVAAKDDDGATAFIHAARNGRLEIVRILMAHPKVDVNEQMRGGETALIWAAEQGHTPIVRLLLANPKIDPNIGSSYINGRVSCLNALMCAAGNGHVQVVRALLAQPKIDLTARNNATQNALMYASVCGQSETVRLLIEAKIDIEAKQTDTIYACNPSDATALDLALHRAKLSTVNTLLSHNAIIRSPYLLLNFLLQRSNYEIDQPNPDRCFPLECFCEQLNFILLNNQNKDLVDRFDAKLTVFVKNKKDKETIYLGYIDEEMKAKVANFANKFIWGVTKLDVIGFYLHEAKTYLEKLKKLIALHKPSVLSTLEEATKQSGIHLPRPLLKLITDYDMPLEGARHRFFKSAEIDNLIQVMSQVEVKAQAQQAEAEARAQAQQAEVEARAQALQAEVEVRAQTEVTLPTTVTIVEEKQQPTQHAEPVHSTVPVVEEKQQLTQRTETVPSTTPVGEEKQQPAQRAEPALPTVLVVEEKQHLSKRVEQELPLVQVVEAQQSASLAVQPQTVTPERPHVAITEQPPTSVQERSEQPNSANAVITAQPNPTDAVIEEQLKTTDNEIEEPNNHTTYQCRIC